jgi:N-acetylglucosaminyldiphosphoundecaprenol N-acetyl-beta-D-mannosaminyltransferase
MALHLGFGGIEKYISSLCKMLEDNYEIEIISTYMVFDKPAFNFSDKIKITYLINDKPYFKEMKFSLNEFKILTFLKYFFKNLIIFINKNRLNIKAIKNINSDIIITTRDFHNKLVGKYANSKIMKIASEHNFHNNDEVYIKNLIASLKGFDYFVVVSNELKKFYKNKINSTKCVCIPNVIDEIYNEPKYNYNHNIVSVGRLSKEKGFADLLDVIDLVKKEIPNIHLDLIGDGNERENLELKVNALELTKNVTLHGFKEGKEKENIITKNSLYVMTSYSESFGIVLIEAMAYGLPCIAFDSASGAREVIIQKDLLIPSRDKYELSKKIIELLNNKEKLTNIGKENYDYCKQYLYSNVVKEWLNVLK